MSSDKKDLEEHLRELNPAQREAALHTRGPLLIVAGAGAGKTKTIAHRILNLIKEGVPAEKILAVTFTNKAAKEMRERVVAALSFVNSREQTLGRRDGAGQRKFSAENFRGESAGADETLPFISTFHSLGVHIIKENARILGHTKYFTILDENDAAALIKEALKELEIDPKQYDPKRIRNIISREKGNFVHAEEFVAESTLGKIISRVWHSYEKKKMQENALDFDDLLLKAVKLLKENEVARKIYQERWVYIHIDEYQDTNEVQYLMSKLLCGENKNICAVGDADQLIYSWRGANLKNILNFERDYPNAKVIMLEENYRSTQNILTAANEIIKKNKYRPEKNLFTKNKTGDKIGLYEALDETDEADFVAVKILELMDSSGGDAFSQVLGSPGPYPGQTILKSTSTYANEGQDIDLRNIAQGDGPSIAIFQQENMRVEQSNILSEIAVLYRANFQSRVLEEAMLRYNIPYQVLGVKFFERKEIKDTLAYLRAALNPESLSDIKRIINFPTRGIGKVTLAKLFSKQQASLPIKMQIKIDNFYKLLEAIKEKIETAKASEVIKYVVKKSGIEEELKNGGDDDLERLENIKELATLALKYDELKNETGTEKLLEDAALASDQDSLLIDAARPVKGREGSQREAFNGVKLMTVHASKGLEFKYVFITGLEDGLFPHVRQSERETAEDREEERRLFYVALTRAKEKLFLSFANFRTIFGSRQINAPSEFIGDIPADLLQKEGGNSIKTIYI